MVHQIRKPEMKVFTVSLTKKQIEQLNSLVGKYLPSRSEIIRFASCELIKYLKDQKLKEKILGIDEK